MSRKSMYMAKPVDTIYLITIIYSVIESDLNISHLLYHVFMGAQRHVGIRPPPDK